MEIVEDIYAKFNDLKDRIKEANSSLDERDNLRAANEILKKERDELTEKCNKMSESFERDIQMLQNVIDDLVKTKDSLIWDIDKLKDELTTAYKVIKKNEVLYQDLTRRIIYLKGRNLYNRILNTD